MMSTEVLMAIVLTSATVAPLLTLGQNCPPDGALSYVILATSARKSDVSSTCTRESCGGTQNVTLYEEMKTYYRGLFLAEDQINQLNEETDVGQELGYCETSYYHIPPPTDNDRCCVTNSVNMAVTGSCKDMNGDDCNIISLDGDQQMVEVGTCEKPSSVCPPDELGRCTQQRSTVTLLCLAQSTPQFRLFYVNSYCACQYKQ